MMKSILVVLTLIFSTLLTAQEIVREINIEGLHPKTAKFTQRFITTKVDDTLDIKKVEQDVQNLLNLRLFSDVIFTTDTLNNGVTLIFKCDKILTFLPIINLGRVKNDPFYQLGFRDLNFLKRKGVLKAYDIIMNNKHSFYLAADVPYIRNSKFGLAVDLKWAETIEPIFLNDNEALYTLSNNYYSGGVFYELNQNHRIYLYNAWYKQSFTKNNETILNSDLPNIRNDKGYQIDIQYKNHKINYQSLYLDGWGLNAELKSTWSKLVPFFMQGIVTGTYYKKIKKKGDFAARLKFGLTTNELGAFGPFSLDSYLNLRGAGTKVDRGTGQLVLNLEYRHSLLETKNICIQGVAFSDLGTWRKNEDSPIVLIKAKTFGNFSGIGTRIFVTKIYDLVFRIDYGVSLTEKNKSGLVLGLGQYF